MEENGGETAEKIVEVLMINSTSGPGLLFPKVGIVSAFGFSALSY